MNYCAKNLCQNGGKCVDQKNGFACDCVDGYEGDRCQIQTDMCQYKKCHNNGVCVSKVNDVSCLCAPGFSGPQCDKGILLCILFVCIVDSFVICLYTYILLFAKLTGMRRRRKRGHNKRGKVG